MRVLIVEDDRVLSLMLSMMVQRLGYRVAETLSEGEEAVQYVQEQQVELILMDIMLEGVVDGIQAIRQIRDFSSVPVIYVTGNSDSTTLERAGKTGYADYLVKPVLIEHLKEAISKI
ncbi:MAG: response regulator [Balneolaceae bacterium]|nr:response regulator [Balneolaceae bacterium]